MKTNQELLDEANKIDFKIKSNGALNARLYGRYERGLYFIKRAIEVHGIDKYQYGKMLEHFVDVKTKVPIICPVHGEFLQSPNRHTSGMNDCPECQRAKVIPTTSSWIDKAREVHGHLYDYSKSVYVNSLSSIEIVCPTHGSFFQRPSSHLAGHGCSLCNGGVLPTLENWLSKAATVHNNKYNYSRISYLDPSEKVCIICPIHGPFMQGHKAHAAGKGCPICGAKIPTTAEWVVKAKEIHGERYDYSKVLYISNSDKVEIICPTHGPFQKTPSNHINNFQGCPKCAGRNHDILYLLKCLDTSWYKIGITTIDVKNRIKQLGGNVEEVDHVVCNNPREHETYLHKLYKDFNVFHEGVRNGNTEFFSLNEDQVKQIIDYMSSIANN